jgi:carbamoylphosphate synthase small subunit
LEKEAKWVKEQVERDAVTKEINEKKMEVKFIDTDIQTKRNIIKELEEREARLRNIPAQD